MPELPEVETTRRGLEPLLRGRKVSAVIVHDARLRRPVDGNLARTLRGRALARISRRAKYLLFGFDSGSLIVHLGMSGSLRVVDAEVPRHPHDHVEIVFDGRRALRLRDPRRFGLMLWTHDDPMNHDLLNALGPEPSDPEFNAGYLYARAAGRRAAVKNFIMDAHVVVGVGNIYASESLFRAGIHPARAAGRISEDRYRRLVATICDVLEEAVAAGGTTLRDFAHNDGKPGYFGHNLKVYARTDAPCSVCRAPIKSRVIGQRSSFFCPRCQH